MRRDPLELAFDSRSAYSSHRTFMAADAGLTSKAHGVGFRVAYSIDITGCKRTDLAFERRPETGVITEARSTLFRGDTTADDGDICEHFEPVAGLEPSEDRSPFTPPRDTRCRQGPFGRPYALESQTDSPGATPLKRKRAGPVVSYVVF